MTVILDLDLDHAKAVQFKCSECDHQLAKLRNCTGSNKKPAAIVVNGHHYSSCPQRMYFEEAELRFAVQLYMDCKESQVLPASGSLMDQTAFACELFSFLDGEVLEWKRSQNEKAQRAAKRGTKNGNRERS